MTTTSLRTSAGRLYTLLENLLAEQPNTRMLEAWASALGVDPGDHIAVMHGVAEALALPSDVRRDIDQLRDVNVELLLLPLPAVERALEQAKNLVQTVNVLTQHLSGETMLGLRHCDSALLFQRPEAAVDEEHVSEWMRTLREVFDQLMADEELDPELKAELLRHLSEMFDSLKLFRVNGIRALEAARDRAYGAMTRRPELIAALQDRPGAWDRFIKVMKDIAVVLGVAGGIFALPGVASEPPPAPPAVEVSVHVDQHLVDDDIVDGEIVEDEDEVAGAPSEPAAGNRSNEGGR